MSGKAFVIAFLLISQALDLVTTYIGFGCGLREGNLLPSWVLSIGGGALLVCFKAAAVALLLGIALALQSRYPRLWHGVVIASVVTMIVVASNAVSIALAMA